jgi:hypothetical protein
MSRKCFLILALTGVALFLAVLPGLVWNVIPVQAQCGDVPPRSACITCHEASAPVSRDDYWHGVHGRKDCCASCHGGNCSTMDASLAHEGVIANPLEDIYTNCHACHPDDYQERAMIFAQTLGITPESRATPTTVPAGVVSDHPMMIQSEAISQSQSSIPWGYMLGGLAFVLAFGFLLRWTYCYIRRCDSDTVNGLNN